MNKPDKDKAHQRREPQNDMTVPEEQKDGVTTEYTGECPVVDPPVEPSGSKNQT